MRLSRAIVARFARSRRSIVAVTLLVSAAVACLLIPAPPTPRARAQGGLGAPPILPVTQDFDDDGFTDLLVPRPVVSDGVLIRGRVRVYSGATQQHRFSLVSGEADDYFGVGADSAGDVNGDGKDDIVIGAPMSQRGGVNAGAVYIFSGADGSLLRATLGAPYERLGRAVAGLGDIDGDGASDYAASHFTVTPGSSGGPDAIRGDVRVLSGAPTSPPPIPGAPAPVPHSATIAAITGPADVASFGAFVRGVGDLNADGAVDFAVAAPREDRGGGVHGAVRIFFGDPTAPADQYSRLAASSNAVIVNPLSGIYDFGRFMLLGKDADSNGVNDFVVGSSFDETAEGRRVKFWSVSLATLAVLEASDPAPLWINTDANGDLKTDTGDVTETLEQFEEETDPLSPFDVDTDGDQVVTANDLSAVLQALGETHPLRDMALSEGGAAAALASMLWLDGGGCDGVTLFGLSGGPVQMTIENPDTVGRGCCLVGTDLAAAVAPESLEVASNCGPTTPGGGGGDGEPESPNAPRRRTGWVSRLPIFDLWDIYRNNRTSTEIDEPPSGGGGGGGGHDIEPRPDVGLPKPNLHSQQRDTDSRMVASVKELTRQGPGEATCNPVLISEGIKSDQESDLLVALPGRDFVLKRSYSAGAMQQHQGFPWMIGNGWGCSVDGWAKFTPRKYPPTALVPGGTNLYDAFEDAVDITRFPMEEGSVFQRRSGDPFGTQYSLFVPGAPTVKRESLIVRGQTVPAWIYEDPGNGQVAFYDTPHSVQLKALNGRILQERDEFGNRWTYEYTVLTRMAEGMLGRGSQGSICTATANLAQPRSSSSSGTLALSRPRGQDGCERRGC